VGVVGIFGINVYGSQYTDARGVDTIKAFFEEYGLVLVVTIIATGMIFFSDEFKDILRDTLITSWDSMTEVIE
jgi:uncharacterized protein (DUF1697 family)